MTNPEMKRCPRCGQTKGRSTEFYVRSNGFTGSWCRDCTIAHQAAKAARASDETRARAAWLARLARHGISADDFAALVAAQGGRCPGCSRALESLSVGDIHIDHNHGCCPSPKSCGACVRGILCRWCNQALGNVGDNTSTLRGLLTYLAGAA